MIDIKKYQITHDALFLLGMLNTRAIKQKLIKRYNPDIIPIEIHTQNYKVFVYNES